MADFPLFLAVLAAATCSAGLVGVAYCRQGPCPVRIRWGQRLFLATLSLLGAGCLFAAWHVHRGVIYFGLAMLVLLLAMLWENPRRTAFHRHASW